VVAEALERGHDVTATDVGELDLTDAAAVARYGELLEPEATINGHAPLVTAGER